jgi:hypothetical protein
MRRPDRDAGGVAVLAKPVRDPVRADRLAELVAEDEVLVGVDRAGDRSLKLLCIAVASQRRDRLGIERDRPLRAACLRRGENQAPGQREDLLLDAQRASVEIDTAPGESVSPTVAVRVPTDLRQAAEAYGHERRWSLGEVVRVGLEQLVDYQRPEQQPAPPRQA